MFNLFRQKELPGIICALRDGAALPPFLKEQAWEYDAKVEGDRERSARIRCCRD